MANRVFGSSDESENKAITFGKDKTKIAEEVSRDLTIQTRFYAVNSTVDLIIKMLSKQVKFNIQSFDDVIKLTQHRLKGKMKDPEKTGTQQEDLVRILDSVEKACETMITHWEIQIKTSTTHAPPFWYFHPTYQYVAATLVEARKSLEEMKESSSFAEAEIQDLKTAIGSMSETLLYQADKDIKDCTAVVTGTLAKVRGVLKKMEGEYKELGPILSTLFNACQTLLDASQSGNPSPETREKVKGQLEFVQKSLEQFLRKIKDNIDKKLPRLRKFKAAEEAFKESTTYAKVLPVKTDADLLKQMLLDENNLRNPEVIESFREAQAKLETTKRTLKTKGPPELVTIIAGLQNVCENAMEESKYFHSSKESHSKILEELISYQGALEEMLNRIESNVDGKSVELKNIKASGPSKSNASKGYAVLEQIAIRRSAKKRELHTLWKRYDRKTEEITSHFDAQKETAQVLSRLTLELRQLENTLRLMEKVSANLSEVKASFQCKSKYPEGSSEHLDYLEQIRIF